MGPIRTIISPLADQIVREECCDFLDKNHKEGGKIFRLAPWLDILATSMARDYQQWHSQNFLARGGVAERVYILWNSGVAIIFRGIAKKRVPKSNGVVRIFSNYTHPLISLDHVREVIPKYIIILLEGGRALTIQSGRFSYFRL